MIFATYWGAYKATRKEAYLAKAKSIANAITLVQEANNGDYPTHVYKNAMAFMIKPSGYQLPLNENKLHRFLLYPQVWRITGPEISGSCPNRENP